MIRGVGLTVSHNFRSLTLTVCERQCFEEISKRDHLIAESVSNEGVCRTALATPGLLNINILNCHTFMLLLICPLLHMRLKEKMEVKLRVVVMPLSFFKKSSCRIIILHTGDTVSLYVCRL